MSENMKNRRNLKTILQYSNSNPIRCLGVLGYACQFCTQCFTEPKHLKEHFTHEHKNNELANTITRRLFEFFVKLDVTSLKCTLCNKGLNKLNEFIDHIKTDHGIDVNTDLKSAIVPFKFDTNKFVCVECSKEFPTFKRLQAHMGVHFSNYICPVCGRGCVTENLYKRHVKRHNAHELKCKDCEKVYGNHEKLYNHQKRVHSGVVKKNKCGMCKERFTDYLHKINHMVKVHGTPEVFLECHLCEKSYKDQRRLTVHIKKDHLLERKHKCRECEMVFFSASSLTLHMAKHTGLRMYKCDVCSKAYGRKNTLREHMRIHTNDRRYSCQYCGQTFVQNCSLRSHIRSKHSTVVKP